MLLHLNAFGERLHVIACMHRDCGLRNDRSRVHIGLNVMDAASGDPDACAEGLTNSIQTFERWKKGWVKVDEPSGVGSDQNWRDDSHPTSHHHRFDVGSPERRHQGVVQGFTGAVQSVIDELPGDFKTSSPFLGSAVRVVHNQQAQRCIEVSLRRRLVKSFEIAARAGRHDSNS